METFFLVISILFRLVKSLISLGCEMMLLVLSVYLLFTDNVNLADARIDRIFAIYFIWSVFNRDFYYHELKDVIKEATDSLNGNR